MNLGLTIIGAGRLGGALAIALEQRGYQIENIVSRSFESADKLAALLVSSAPRIFSLENLTGFAFSKTIFITTPDPVIESVANKLFQLEPPPETIFLHTSGALSSDVLRQLRKVDGKIGSLHPLISVSDAQIGANKFSQAYFCLEGDPEAVAFAQKIVAALAGNPFSIASSKKSLYHAAAVLSSGHVVALFDLATKTLTDCGLKKQEAQKILLPLVQSTIENLAQQLPAQALTGTFARTDLETMKKHLAALAGRAAFETYVKLGLHSLEMVAQNKMVNAENLALMRNELSKLS